MHVTTKETDQNGAHVLTSVIEADGASELASEKATLAASVVSCTRTASGGIQVVTSVAVTEPAPEAPKPEAPVSSPEDEAAAYLVSKGKSEDEAKGAVERFGAQAILAKRQQDLDAELDALVS